MATVVQPDRSKTLMLAAYLVVVGAIGISLVALTYVYNWGFLGYMFGGIALVAGLGGVSAMAAGGGAWKADCPSCGQTLKWESGQPTLNQAKLVCCGHCKTWVQGTENLAPVEPGYVSDEAVFVAPVGDTLQWPEGCPTCGAPATRMVEVEGRSALGSAAMMVAGGGVQRVWVILAPACGEHDNGVWAMRAGDTGKELWFRSFDYFRAFVDLNPIIEAPSGSGD